MVTVHSVVVVVVLICLFIFQVLSKEQHERANRNEYNFDHPGKKNNLFN